MNEIMLQQKRIESKMDQSIRTQESVYGKIHLLQERNKELEQRVEQLEEWVSNLQYWQMQMESQGMTITKPVEKKKVTKKLIAIERPVSQYTMEGQLVKCWRSVREVGLHKNYNPRSIIENASGRTGSSAGYKWLYTEEA